MLKPINRASKFRLCSAMISYNRELLLLPFACTRFLLFLNIPCHNLLFLSTRVFPTLILSLLLSVVSLYRFLRLFLLVAFLWRFIGRNSCTVCTAGFSRVGPANGQHEEEEDVDKVLGDAGEADLVVDPKLHVHEVGRGEAGH